MSGFDHTMLMELLRQRIPKFEPVRVIGEGAMGTVLEVYDKGMRARRAVKVMNPLVLTNDIVVARFRDEAAIMDSLVHPNIVRVYEVGELKDDPDDDDEIGFTYIVLEWCDGGSLADYVHHVSTTEQERVAPRLAVDVALQVLSGLQAAHENGVIHRDIKPDNILLSGKGKPKVADFGIAREVDSDAHKTATSTGLGTPGYMAPEQIDNASKAQEPADVFSVAITLWNMLTGSSPTSSVDSMIGFYLKFQDDPSLMVHVPDVLIPILRKAASIERQDRYQSANAFAEALREVYDQLPESPEDHPPLSSLPQVVAVDTGVPKDSDTSADPATDLYGGGRRATPPGTVGYVSPEQLPRAGKRRPTPKSAPPPPIPSDARPSRVLSVAEVMASAGIRGGRRPAPKLMSFHDGDSMLDDAGTDEVSLTELGITSSRKKRFVFVASMGFALALAALVFFTSEGDDAVPTPAHAEAPGAPARVEVPDPTPKRDVEMEFAYGRLAPEQSKVPANVSSDTRPGTRAQEEPIVRPAAPPVLAQNVPTSPPETAPEVAPERKTRKRPPNKRRVERKRERTAKAPVRKGKEPKGKRTLTIPDPPKSAQPAREEVKQPVKVATVATVRVGLNPVGNAQAWLVGNGKTYRLPRSVPPGTYKLRAKFNGGAKTSMRTVKVVAGKPFTIKCVADFENCK